MHFSLINSLPEIKNKNYQKNYQIYEASVGILSSSFCLEIVWICFGIQTDSTFFAIVVVVVDFILSRYLLFETCMHWHSYLYAWWIFVFVPFNSFIYWNTDSLYFLADVSKWVDVNSRPVPISYSNEC